MLALNSEFTNKNVMLEKKLVLLEQRYNALLAQQEKDNEPGTKEPGSVEQEDDFKQTD
jgi:hypothetical protein